MTDTLVLEYHDNCEHDIYYCEVETFTPKQMPTSQILMQALDLLDPVPVGPHYGLTRWMQEEYVGAKVEVGETEQTVKETACSMGAMLLATDMDELSAVDWNAVPYLAADPNFRRAMQMLVLQIVANPVWRAEALWHVMPANAHLVWHNGRPGELLTGTDPHDYDTLLPAIVTHWNDQLDRTDHEVYEVFTDAIKAALREEEQA